MFQSSLPVTDSRFFDRQEQLKRLLEQVDRLSKGTPVWMAILGQRKVGKTSLLLELSRRRAGAGVAFAILDVFEDTPVTEAFFRRYALRVLDAFLSSSLGLSLEALASRPSDYRAALLPLPAFRSMSPSLQRDVLELPERSPNAELVRTALDLPERLARELDRRICVAMDEFQELAALKGTRGRLDIMPLMRSIWQRHSRVNYIISGSARTMLTELVTSEHSPFFQHFEIMELHPFGREEAIQFLVQASAPDLPIPAGLAAKAVQAIGGHPFYLQLVGEGLTRQSPPLDDGALRSVLQELLFSRTGRLSLYFEAELHRLVGRSSYLAASLDALADGRGRLSDIATTIGAPSGATVRYLERLGDAVAKTQSGTYILTDPVFNLWLRWRRPGGTVLPMSLLGDLAERQTVELLAGMGFELIYQSRASRGAFDLLATRGARQLGIQVKRSGLPLRYSLEAWRRLLADARRFGWRWVVAAVTPDGQVLLLDPARARMGREARLEHEAAIENLLLWVDQEES